MRCKPWFAASKLFGVGEAPGETEDRVGYPFVGASGQLLDQMLGDAGIRRGDISLSNVFMDRPPTNRLEAICCSHAEAVERSRRLHLGRYLLPAISQGQYLQPHFFWELLRLRQELIFAQPNLVIAFGNTALWALCSLTGIKKYRGTILESTLVPGLKVLPTIHPSSVLREYDQRTIVTADLIKAKNEAAFPEIIYPEREILTAPSIENILHFKRNYLDNAPVISVDIETIGPFISCIGFAPSSAQALVIPFIYPHSGESYWTAEEEVEVYLIIKDILETAPSILMQNGLFDTQYFLLYQMLPHSYNRDTMFKQHAMYPGVLKGLAFLASIYCNERAWKTLRPRRKLKMEETEKDDD